MTNIMGYFLYLVLGLVLFFLVKRTGLLDAPCNAVYVSFMAFFTVGFNAVIGDIKKQLFRNLHSGKHPLRMLEIGAGSGANFAFYPKDCRVTCLEPKKEFGPHLRENARKYLSEPETMEIVHELAEDLRNFESESFDAVVMTLVMCSVDDVCGLLAAVKRVLKPGGKLYYLEHVAGEGLMRTVQELVSIFWPHVCDGCIMTKQTWRPIENAGFSSVDHRRFMAPLALHYLPLRPQLVGTATK